MKITTESGTVYEVAGEKIRRLPQPSTGMRRDNEWLSFTLTCPPVIGEGMRLVLEPLGEGDCTFRFTSRVVAIEGGEKS